VGGEIAVESQLWCVIPGPPGKGASGAGRTWFCITCRRDRCANHRTVGRTPNSGRVSMRARAGEAGDREAEGIRRSCRCVALSALRAVVVCSVAAPSPAHSRAPLARALGLTPTPADRRMHAGRDADSTATETMASREVKDQAKAVEMAFKQGAKESQRQGGFDPNRSHNSMARVKNKQPAPVQITAEQLLREARERQEGDGKPPRQQFLQSPLSDFTLHRKYTRTLTFANV
jgi:hypothetical protein